MNNLAAGLMALKRYDEARSVLDRAIGVGERVWGADHPQFGLLLHTRGELAAATGELDLAEACLDRKGYATYRPLALYELAQVSARLGRTEPAVDLLARALELGYAPEGSAPSVADDPQLASIRAHPRFRALASGGRPGAPGSRGGLD
jgi:tetratricopeptide (TPR) repeat protein